MRTIVDGKVGIHEMNGELSGLKNHIDEVYDELKHMIKSGEGMKRRVDSRGNMDDDLMELLSQKASKKTVAESLHKKANRSEIDALLAQKADLNEIDRLTQIVHSTVTRPEFE